MKIVFRTLASFFFGLFATCVAAFAQTGGCIDDTTVWTTPYQNGSIQATSYFVNVLVLGVYFRSGSTDIYVNVPVSVAQAFQATTNNNADPVYQSRVQGKYREALLAEVTLCPLLNEQTGDYLLAEH